MKTKAKATTSKQVAAGFAGFSPEAFAFFAQLAEQNNDREWFQEHRGAYEATCRDPMKGLLLALGTNPTKARLSRINRDLRFTKDKSPYKTYIAAGFDGNYVSLSASGVYVAAGLYDPQPPALQRWRDGVDHDKTGRALARTLDTLRRKGFEVNTHEGMKRVPRGYDAEHPRADLLMMKGVYAGRSFAPSAWKSPEKTLGALEKAIGDLAPLRGWILENVGTRM